MTHSVGKIVVDFEHATLALENLTPLYVLLADGPQVLAAKQRRRELGRLLVGKVVLPVRKDERHLEKVLAEKLEDVQRRGAHLLAVGVGRNRVVLGDPERLLLELVRENGGAVRVQQLHALGHVGRADALVGLGKVALGEHARLNDFVKRRLRRALAGSRFFRLLRVRANFFVNVVEVAENLRPLFELSGVDNAEIIKKRAARGAAGARRPRGFLIVLVVLDKAVEVVVVVVKGDGAAAGARSAGGAIVIRVVLRVRVGGSGAARARVGLGILIVIEKRVGERLLRARLRRVLETEILAEELVILVLELVRVGGA